MRTWRKIYASLLESEQVAQLSDGALVLFIFLIIGQDDSGYYPWNDSKLRRLTVTRPLHTRDDFVTWRDELVTAGVARIEAGGVVLINGAILNGVPRKDLKPELYPRDESVQTRYKPVTPRDENVTLEQSRLRVEVEKEESNSAIAIAPESPILEDQSLWPIWFSLLWGIKGFKMDFATAETWRIETGISEDLAERKAYRIRDWWLRQPKKRQSEGDPYRTWQGWCRDERDKDGYNPDKAAIPTEDPQAAFIRQEAKEMKERKERAEAQRRNVQPGSSPSAPERVT